MQIHLSSIRQLLVRPKDKIDKERVVGPVYQINCTNCNTFYIGETERSLKARFLEHRRPSTVTSEVSRHINHECPTHNISMSNTKILTTEPRWFERGVKEAIYIRTNQPPLNKDGGRQSEPSLDQPPPKTIGGKEATKQSLHSFSQF